MKHSMKFTAAASMFALGITACASQPDPNPRLMAAETALSSAKSNAETMEMGRASLEKAEYSLTAAKQNYADRDEDDYIHAIRMTEGYIELAETRGDQKRAEMAISDIKAQRAQIQIASSERESAAEAAAKRAAMAEAARAEQAAQIADAQRAAAEARNQQLRTQLAGYEMRESNTGMTLVLQDLQFPTNSSTLSAGAQTRLAPLLNYLQSEPAARIRIEGHTDSQGDDASNMSLSQRRADSVRAFLTAQGISFDRIQTAGMGETRPIASNDTVSGREENRRVEVTILN